MKRTVGACLLVVGVSLAIASVGFVFTWPLGMLIGVGLTVAGAAMTGNPEVWI